jgi:hypothetical protein
MSFFDSCGRCGKTPLEASTTSYFNTENICMDCARRERAHPKYAEAQRIESEAVKRGDYNFPGIGCPPELYRPEFYSLDVKADATETGPSA